ncbi:MAG: large conductance mechanosensitive channel protein MscL [Brevefilum sp.]|jgi:large conductance mechanosensitive channel
MKKLFNEFKDFIMQGDVMDLAIGIIIGGAFGTVVSSVVDNLLMPPLGLLLGGVNFQDLFIVLKQGEGALPAHATLQMAKDVGAVTFNYGQFLTDVISFILLGLGVFLIIKGLNLIKDKVKKEEETAPSEKECPFCKSSIPINATRCPLCTSQLEASPD